MKTAPLYRLLKELSGKGRQPNVIAFEGVRAEESSTRATYARIGRFLIGQSLKFGSIFLPIIFQSIKHTEKDLTELGVLYAL